MYARICVQVKNSIGLKLAKKSADQKENNVRMKCILIKS